MWPLARPGAGQALCAEEDEVHVWWLDLREPAWSWPQLWTWLDADELARAGRFHFEQDRLRHVAAHGQMRALLGAYLGVAPGEVRFAAGPNGKPQLLPRGAEAHVASRSGITFSLSHSEDEGLLAVTKAGPALGADIEVRRPMNDLEALARRYFAPGEQAALLALPAAEQHDAFFAVWTRKEAYLKAQGVGLAVELGSFEVTVQPDGPAALRSIDGRAAPASTWTLWSSRPTARSLAAVAISATPQAVRCRALGPPPAA